MCWVLLVLTSYTSSISNGQINDLFIYWLKNAFVFQCFSGSSSFILLEVACAGFYILDFLHFINIICVKSRISLSIGYKIIFFLNVSDLVQESAW